MYPKQMDTRPGLKGIRKLRKVMEDITINVNRLISLEFARNLCIQRLQSGMN